MAGGMSWFVASIGFLSLGIWYYRWGYRMVTEAEAERKKAVAECHAAQDSLAAALGLICESRELYDTAKAFMDRAEGI